MRSRSYLTILAAMLLVSIGIVNAEEPAAPVITEQASESIDNDGALMTPVEPVACGSQVLTDDLKTEGYSNKCGQCSVHSYCRGLTRGTPCPGGTTWCIPVDTMFCPGTDDWDCKCARYYN
jgi:hypothetical protein